MVLTGSTFTWAWLVPFLICYLLVTGARSWAPPGTYVVHTIKPQDQLLMVQAVFRHGARTPLSTMYWPNTTYGDCKAQFQGPTLQLVDESGAGQDMSPIDLDMPKLPGGCRQGQLTPDGYEMARSLGAWLRKSYAQGDAALISPDLQASEVFLRSTRIQRAIQTLQGVVAGLWPDQAQPNTTLTVNASTEDWEYEYGNGRTCPALQPLSDKLTSMVKARDAADPVVQQAAANVSGALQLPGGPANVVWVRLYDTLAAMAAHTGTQLPPGLTPDIMHTVEAQAMHDESRVLAPQPEDQLLPAAECPHVVQLSVGPLLWHLQQNIRAHTGAARRAAEVAAASSALPRHLRGGHTSLQPAPGPSALPRLYLYSGHDSTITPLRAALGRPETRWPPFTGNVVLELWRIYHGGSGLRVRVRYDVAITDQPGPWGGTEGGWFTVEELQARLAPFTLSPEEHQQQCKQP